MYFRRSVLACAIALTSLPSSALALDAPIIQPGAPGEEGKVISAKQATKLANISYSPYDVTFMQDMIVHHKQAVEMALLASDRTNNKDVLDIASRIKASQDDEIAFMRRWLEERDESTKSKHASHAHHAMMGMASKQQMSLLANAKGTDYDRQFLTLMIRHHKGAVHMVNELHDKPGTAFDPVLYTFTTDVVNDQEAEMERMSKMLDALSDDPRTGLAAGYLDAEVAIKNLIHVGLVEKPDGFVDPSNQLEIMPKSDDADADESEPEERYPLMSFSNTDMAFFGDILVAGNYHGFNIYRLSDKGLPTLVSSVVCPGGQGDVSVVGDLLIMSVEEERARLDCGLQGIEEDVSSDRFMGVRIFDISDLTHPKQVGAVQTCRGSHTHSIVRSDDETILLYNSGTSGVRSEKELENCIGDVAGDERTALFRIDVIEIPVKAPHKAKIVASPKVFSNEETGVMAGLWRGGDHGDQTQDTYRTDQCHDITVFPSKNIAAGACSGNGIIFDITNPLQPKRLDAVVDKGFQYWHSATFNNDGTKVIFTDEWGGGVQPRCRAADPMNWGANAIYDIVDNKLVYRSHFKLPAAQGETENCVAHNGAIVPVKGRDLMVQAWYQGGLTILDFTDSSNPKEIAYFDRGPLHDDKLIAGGYWSAYFYKGMIYGTEIYRGIDVFELAPSADLSADEIETAKRANQGKTFNPQTQLPVTW